MSLASDEFSFKSCMESEKAASRGVCVLCDKMCGCPYRQNSNRHPLLLSHHESLEPVRLRTESLRVHITEIKRKVICAIFLAITQSFFILPSHLLLLTHRKSLEPGTLRTETLRVDITDITRKVICAIFEAITLSVSFLPSYLLLLTHHESLEPGTLKTKTLCVDITDTTRKVICAILVRIKLCVSFLLSYLLLLTHHESFEPGTLRTKTLRIHIADITRIVICHILILAVDVTLHTLVNSLEHGKYSIKKVRKNINLIVICCCKVAFTIALVLTCPVLAGVSSVEPGSYSTEKVPGRENIIVRVICWLFISELLILLAVQISSHLKKNCISKILSERENQCEKYTCAYCKLLLNDPHQSRCGHRFCKPCISDLLRETESFTCQLCDPETEPDVDNIITAKKIFRDNAIKKEMKVLNTKCINDDCSWFGKFEDYGDHRQSCNYGVIPCPSGCGYKIRRLNIDEHRNNECLSRYVYCEYCHMHLQAKAIKDHHTQCPEIEVECEFCGQKVIRRQIQSHMDISSGNCPRKMKPCQFQVIGCNMMVELEKEDIHNAAFIKEHLDMIFQQIAILLNFRSQAQENAGEVRRLEDNVQKHQEVMLTLRQSLKHMEDYLREQPHFATSKVPNSSLKDFTTVLEKLTKSNKDLEIKSNKIEDSVATYVDVVAMLSQEVEKSSDMIQAMVGEDKNFRERLDAVEKKTKAQDRIIALKDVTLAEQDLRIQSLEMASYDGILTWKITDFGRKRRDAISGRTLSLYSPYFFSSRFGYKMCARIYLNGDGMGKGNHVSLFFVVMKGDFDAILKWPFRQKVTFMWIDQNNREHMIDAFRPDPNSSSFKRPTGDMNIASGCPLFMPLSMLESSQHAYVKDNTAFLRVIVDTHDL